MYGHEALTGEQRGHTMQLTRSFSRARAAGAALTGAAALCALTVLAAAGVAVAGASGVPRCTTADLVVWLDTQGNGAAGSSYYSLELTNLSGRRCTVSGYPGVTAVNLAGHQLGRAATRDPVHPAA